MAFLKSVTGNDVGPILYGRSVMLRMPLASDYGAWAELRARSREFLVPWEPAWTRDELSRAAYRRRLRFYQKELRDETGYAFLMFDFDDDALVGGLSLSNIRRGVTQSCSIGYWVGAPYANKEYMTDALRTVIPFVFQSLGLHRLEAACLPNNTASVRVLEKAGFAGEGRARKYLRINGVWQDHLLFALLREEYRD